ncbi:MAG: pilus assembly protein PilP [Desulfobacterales bacterium]|nr:pilus assembly protein PilP [Desulfobacterales bacterium]
MRKSVWVILLAGVLACGEEPPPAPQPKAVSKKIAVQQAQPTPVTTKPSPVSTPSPEAGQAAPLGTAVSPTPAASPGAASVPAIPPAPGSPGVELEKVAPGVVSTETSDTPQGTAAPALTPPVGDASPLVKESMQLAASYDAEGRFDPFEPLFKEQQTQSMSSSKDKRSKRIPQTPLEKVALAQLKVTAIIRASSGNRALVEDATGKGYVVKVGTYMGLNSGQVVRIDNDRVLVEEEIENIAGELTVENQELKLQKPAGEL